MSKYYIYNGRLYSEEELRHAMPARGVSALKGIEKANHKYVKREWKNGKWQYTYPQDLKSNKASVDKSTSEMAKVVPKAASAVNAGKNAINKMTATSGAYVSKEYKEEVEYNSKTNEYPEEKKTEKILKENVIEEKKQTEQKLSEYEAELEANSKKNVYPKNESSKSNVKTSKTQTVASGAMFDDLLKKIGDIGESIEDFADDVGEWFEDLGDDLYDATIGGAKDALGFDEREYVYSTKAKLDESIDKVNDGIERVEIRIAAANGKIDDDTREGIDAKVKVWLEPACEKYLEADAEYEYAKEKYNSTPLGRIESWLNGGSTAQESDDARLTAKRLDTDPWLKRAETNYVTNEMLMLAIQNYMDGHSKKHNESAYGYYQELVENRDELYRKLERASYTVSDTAYIRPGHNPETDRVERIIQELQDLFDRT